MTAGEPMSPSHPETLSLAPHCLQNTASVTVTGWPHCEQKRARVVAVSAMRFCAMPPSAMEHKRRVAQPHVVSIGEPTGTIDALAPHESAVLTGQVAQGETAVLRHDRRVMARDRGVGDDDIVVDRPAQGGGCARTQFVTATQRVDQARRRDRSDAGRHGALLENGGTRRVLTRDPVHNLVRRLACNGATRPDRGAPQVKTQLVVRNSYPVALSMLCVFDSVAIEKHALLHREVLQHVTVATALDHRMTRLHPGVAEKSDHVFFGASQCCHRAVDVEAPPTQPPGLDVEPRALGQLLDETDHQSDRQTERAQAEQPRIEAARVGPDDIEGDAADKTADPSADRALEDVAQGAARVS